MNTYNMVVCNVDITFRSPADGERVELAANFIQKSFQSLQSHGSQVSRDGLLAILAIGLADDLFELQKEHAALQNGTEGKPFDEKKIEMRLQKMLDSINSIIPVEK